MRATLLGRQIALTPMEKKFVGVNIGFNNVTEHEGTMEFVKLLNYRHNPRQVIKGIKATNGWRHTPFGDYMLFPDCNYLTREITIDNSSLKLNNPVLQTVDGNYTLLWLSREASGEAWAKLHGFRRKFSESDFLNLMEYQTNPPQPLQTMNMHRSGTNTILVDKEFAAAWASDGLLLLMNKDICGCDIVSGIIKAMKNGSLAAVPSEQRLFASKGLCLIDLDMAYNPLGRLM